MKNNNCRKSASPRRLAAARWSALFALMTLLPSVAFAMEPVVGQWTTKDTVERVYPYSGGMAFVMKTHSVPGKTCDDGRQFFFSTSDANYDAKVSTILAAFLSGKEISFVRSAEQESSCRSHVDRFQVF